MESDDQLPLIKEEAISQSFAEGVMVLPVGAGSEGERGVVTQRRLSRGELVLQEAPFLLVTSTAGEESEAAEDGSLEALILGRLREVSPEDHSKFWTLKDSRFDDGSRSAVGIFLTNRVEISELTGGDELVGDGGDELASKAGLDRSRQRHALFLLGSFFNHSCSPNVYWSERPAQGEVVWHVLRDVEAGEALTITYSQAALSMPSNRRQELLTSWRFTCKCAACTLTDAARKASDDRRICLNFKLQQLSSGHVYPLAHDEDVQAARRAIEADPLRGISVVREICALLDEELSGHAPTKSWACVEGFALADAIGRHELSLELLETSHVENCVAEGEDSENSQALGRLLAQRRGGDCRGGSVADQAVSASGSRGSSQSSGTANGVSAKSRGKPRRKSRDAQARDGKPRGKK